MQLVCSKFIFVAKKNCNRAIGHPSKTKHWNQIGNKEEIYWDDKSSKPASDCSMFNGLVLHAIAFHVYLDNNLQFTFTTHM